MIVYEIICRFFLWDGRSYGDSFITSRKVNGDVLNSVQGGSVIKIKTYSVIKQSPPLVFLREFEVIDLVYHILKTPLSLQTMPTPLTLAGFERYLSSVNRLSTLSFLSSTPAQTSIPTQSSKRSIPQSSSIGSGSGISDISASSLSYEDKRLYKSGYYSHSLGKFLSSLRFMTNSQTCIQLVRIPCLYVNEQILHYAMSLGIPVIVMISVR